MLPIIYMLCSIDCFDFSVLLFKESCFIECLKLLVSQKNNVCGWVCACVCVYIVIVMYFPCI